ncbi:ribbon-helix-helix domain-containing protein [Variovorax sp. E3]|uniref:ribbon-helix-helix domain-containing protein n=1 Tax=Variovorax sp. E3 TaxID=1914993 RepID=UPI0035B4ED08
MAPPLRNQDARTGRGQQAAGYVQPGRVGKKALVGYFDKVAHKVIRQVALDLDRNVEDLMEEAFHDLLVKMGRHQEAVLFEG